MQHAVYWKLHPSSPGPDGRGSIHDSGVRRATTTHQPAEISLGAVPELDECHSLVLFLPQHKGCWTWPSHQEAARAGRLRAERTLLSMSTSPLAAGGCHSGSNDTGQPGTTAGTASKQIMLVLTAQPFLPHIFEWILRGHLAF